MYAYVRYNQQKSLMNVILPFLPCKSTPSHYILACGSLTSAPVLFVYCGFRARSEIGTVIRLLHSSMTLCTDNVQVTSNFGKLIALTKAYVLCRSNEGKSNCVSMRRVGMTLSSMTTRIENHCEEGEIICYSPKSNETVSIHHVELSYTCIESNSDIFVFLFGMCLTFLPDKNVAFCNYSDYT